MTRWGISEEKAHTLWYVAGRVNCVERKASFVFETPKACIRISETKFDKKLPERSQERERYGPGRRIAPA